MSSFQNMRRASWASRREEVPLGAGGGLRKGRDFEAVLTWRLRLRVYVET